MGYTWTCADCPTWAETYWPTHDQAHAEADGAHLEHREACPGQARLIIITAPARSPEQFGAEQRIGAYDPSEPLLVPTWAVLVARSALGMLSRHIGKQLPADFSDADVLRVWAGAILVADPIPDRPKPAGDSDLAELLREACETLTRSLPAP